ncbi:MAG: histidine kinase [Desulfovibrionaceae bacterium]|nr:histidine kinase [Desulfovibrionaceae bacterium]MBF0512976.1 histidine kinase [Desulfovibrionaceae bacterium]
MGKANVFGRGGARPDKSGEAKGAMPNPDSGNEAQCGIESRLDVRAEMAALIVSAPPGVRGAIFDLMGSVKTGLDAIGKKSIPHKNRDRVKDWQSLLTALTGMRLYLDRVQSSRIDRLRHAHPNYAILEHRFELLKRAYEDNTLMIEILFALINAGSEFQTPSEVLEQSAEIMLAELEADLFVCRLRDREGNWKNIAANTAKMDQTPLFVLDLEENFPFHPVMRAVAGQNITYVLSNNLQGSERGGESYDCVPYQEGYRSRLAFILRDLERKAFGLIMLYSRAENFFSRYDSKFLGDCSRVVSLTVGSRLEVGRDALAKAAGGMAHVGNNALALLRNCLEIVAEEIAVFAEDAAVFQSMPVPEEPFDQDKARQAAGMVRAAQRIMKGFDAEPLRDSVRCALEGAERLRGAIANLLEAVENPVIMHYIRGEEVLDLDPRNK